MPRVSVRPQNRWIQAIRVPKVSNAASRDALHNLRATHSAFVHTQTPLPAFDQTRVHATHDGKHLLIAIAPDNSIGPRGLEESVEIFFDPFHDHLGYFQFYFEHEGEPQRFDHVPYREAGSTRFRWMDVVDYAWEDERVVNVVGVPEQRKWLFARFRVDDVFRNGPVVGFNVCRYRSAINEATSWNLASGNGFVDAYGFGNLHLGDGRDVASVQVTDAQLDDRRLRLSGTAVGLKAFDLEVADPRDVRGKVGLKVGAGGQWSAALNLPGNEPGRYRLYPRAGDTVIEPECLVFDLAAPAQRRDFKLGMMVDVPDDLRNNYYTKGRLDEQIGMLQDWGVRRLYWIDYGPTDEDRSFWQSCADPRFCAATAESMGDMLPAAVKIAHNRGMDLVGIFKPFDMGFTTAPIFDEPAADRVPTPENRYSGVATAVAEHQHCTMSAREGWLTEPRGPITTLRFLSERPLPKLSARNVTLLVSDDNRKYRAYRGRPTVRVSEAKVPHRRFTPRGPVDDGGSRRVWTLELGGLKLPARFASVQIQGGPALKLEARVFEAVEALDASGRSVGLQLHDGGSVEKGFTFLATWASWANHTDRWLRRMRWDGKPLGIALRPRQRMHELLEPMFEQSRRVWLRCVKRLLDAGCDVVDIRTLCHHSTCNSWLAYAFAEPVVETFKERFGRDLELTEDDYEAIRRLRGEAYTQFMREASEMTRARGKRFCFHLETGQEVPVSLHTRMHLHLDWERWIEEGMVDEIMLKYWGAQSPFVHERVLPLAKRKGIAVHICEPNFTLATTRGIERAIRLATEAADAGFAGYAFYENASYMALNPAGRSLPYGHADHAIRAAADALGQSNGTMQRKPPAPRRRRKSRNAVASGV